MLLLSAYYGIPTVNKGIKDSTGLDEVVLWAILIKSAAVSKLQICKALLNRHDMNTL